MFPILIALLLAAWLFEPWSYAEYVYIPGNDGHAQAWAEERDTSYLSSAARVEQLFLKETPASPPVPTPVPPTPSAPTPTPPATLAPDPGPAPTPAPTPTPAIPLYVLSSEELKALICSLPWPCEEALRVKWCESGNRWDAIGAGGNYGGFQINAIHARRIPEFWTSWMDPAKNTAWAFDIWSRQGWKPWGCRPA